MTRIAHYPARIVVTSPRGVLSHPITAENVCTVIARLAPYIGNDATWTVRPATTKPTG